MFPNASNKYKIAWYVFGFIMFAVAIASIKFTPSDVLTMISVIIGSFALSIKTAKENYGHESALYRFIASKGERWAKWFDGGNETYDPAYPFTMDFWHLLRDMAIYTLTAAVVFASGNTFWLIIPFVENMIFQTKSTLFKDGNFPITKLASDFFSTKNKFAK